MYGLLHTCMITVQFAPTSFVGQVRTYRFFEGSVANTMQRLLTGQEHGLHVDTPRLPLSPKQLMELRLGSIGAEGDHTSFQDVYINTNMAILSDPHSNAVKYVRDHPLLYTLTPETRLVRGSLPLTKEQYDHSDGFVFTADESETLQHKQYALPKRRKAFWEYAAEGDTTLTKDYITYVTQKTKLSFDQVMGLDFLSRKGLRSWVAGRPYYGSNGGDNFFRRDRLAGVAAEPCVVAQKIADAHAWKKSLEQRVV